MLWCKTNWIFRLVLFCSSKVTESSEWSPAIKLWRAVCFAKVGRERRCMTQTMRCSFVSGWVRVTTFGKKFSFSNVIEMLKLLPSYVSHSQTEIDTFSFRLMKKPENQNFGSIRCCACFKFNHKSPAVVFPFVIKLLFHSKISVHRFIIEQMFLVSVEYIFLTFVV